MSRRKSRSKARRQGPTSIPSPAQMALLVALAAAPALFNIQSGASFEPDKAAALIVLALVALVDILWRSISAGEHGRRAPRMMREPWALLLAGLAAGAGVITLLAVDPVTSLWGNYDRGYGLLTILAGLIFLLVAREMARSGRSWLLVDAALLGAVIPLLYGFMQMLSLDPVRGVGVSFPLGQRASSTLGNPLYLGDYLLIIILLGLARRILHSPARAAARRILELFIAAALALLTLTFSRSAYLGALVAGAALLIFLGIQQRTGAKQDASSLRSPHPAGPNSVFGGKWLLPAGLAALIGGGLLLLLLWPKLQHGGTLQQRLLIWQAVIDMLRRHPRRWLMGLGFDALPLRLAPYLSPALAHFEPDFAFRIPDRAHNLLLDLLSTGGLLWLLGWLTLGGMALWRLARSRNPLAPWLAAIILGRGALLLFSFPTHVPDLLFWMVLGVSFGLGDGRDIQGLRDLECLETPAIAAFGVIGFSLSAAWPGGLLLWLLAAIPLLALLLALSPPRPLAPSPPRLLALSLLILPAILLNQHIGPAAQLAWVWLLLWLLALSLFTPWPAPDKTARLLKIALIALLMLPVTLPRLGDIAYKSALLSLDGTQRGDYRRDVYFAKALHLAPYDHVMDAGMAWVMARRLQPDADSYDARAQRIVRMYLSAMAAQPAAPEPPADLARWLAHLAANDPRYAPQAQDAFDRALALSPHDIQTLNDQAMFWASQGRTDDAIAELQRLLTLDPLYGPTYRNLAQVYRQEGDEDAARTIIEQGREHVPWWDVWGN